MPLATHINKLMPNQNHAITLGHTGDCRLCLAAHVRTWRSLAPAGADTNNNYKHINHLIKMLLYNLFY